MSLNSFRVGFQKVLGTKLGYAIVAVIAILLVFTFVYSGLGNNSMGGGKGAASAQNETIATVNGDAITRGDFDQAVDSLQRQAEAFGQTISPLRSALLHATALDQLITTKLQLQAANKLGLKASDAEINKARLDAVRQHNIAQTLGLKPTASLTEIDNALAQNGQPSLESGILSDESVGENVLQDKLQTYENNKIVVTEQDARDFYKEYHTRHILIDNKKRSDVQAKSQAQQILAKAQAPGADFAALAKQYSEDTGTKDKGGDDGWIGEDNQFNSYVPEFVQATQALKPGQVTLIASPHFGYFIIKLEAIRSNLPKDFDKNPAKYIDQVKQQKQEQGMQDFVTALKNDPHNKIVVTDPQIRADRTMQTAATESDTTKRQADYRSAVADYKKALASNPPAQQTGEINVQLGQAYQSLQQPKDAIAAFVAALNSTDDADLRMELGSLYMQNKQDKEAAEQFQAASKLSWDNQALHQQLLMTYLQMKRPDLVAQERDWLKKYDERQKQMQATSPLGGPSGIQMPPVTTPAQTPATPQSVQVVPSPAPGAATVVPASGSPAPPAKKPAQ